MEEVVAMQKMGFFDTLRLKKEVGKKFYKSLKRSLSEKEFQMALSIASLGPLSIEVLKLWFGLRQDNKTNVKIGSILWALNERELKTKLVKIMLEAGFDDYKVRLVNGILHRYDYKTLVRIINWCSGSNIGERLNSVIKLASSNVSNQEMDEYMDNIQECSSNV
jgi:hypothetical protein